MTMRIRKLTNSTDETSVSDLFSNDLVFSIPYFQRAYKWNEKNIKRFEEDLSNLIDYDDDDMSHFLGAIIVFGKPTNPSDPRFYEVIDGQQRITTCYLALLALAKTFSTHEMVDDAFAIYQKYLIITRKTSYITNAKLICCKEDRAGINHIFQDLASNEMFLRSIQEAHNEYKLMPNTGNDIGRAWKNYKLLCKFFESIYQDGEKISVGEGGNALQKYYGKLVSNMRVVQIVVNDPTDGPKIFDSLNSKQEPMTIGDLVRNELFSKFADREDEDIDALDRDYWHPFYEKFKQKDNKAFDKVFEQYFFPYVLTQNHSTKKADAFNFLRGQWARIDDPKEIIQSLAKYQDVFIDLYYGTDLTVCSPEIKKAIHRFYRMGTPTSVYPFLMQVVSAATNEEIDNYSAEQILSRVESFLVRRVVCGYEPTGLHATFKSLWNDCAGNYSVDNVVAEIQRHYTVKWPDNDEFERNIKTRPLYKVKITPYLLAEWNGKLGGDIPELDSLQIEHVLPEKLPENSQWTKDWTRAQHEEKLHCLANLLPLSSTINSSLQNADYTVKRPRYIADSALKAPREFGKKYDKWTPIEFEERATELSKWALERWKY